MDLSVISMEGMENSSSGAFNVFARAIAVSRRIGKIESSDSKIIGSEGMGFRKKWMDLSIGTPRPHRYSSTLQKRSTFL
jgi:hypothetical protein